MEEAHFLENGVAPQREHRFVPLANQAKGQDGAKVGQDEPKMGKDGPRMDYVGQVVSTLGRSWADIVQKLQEEWKKGLRSGFPHIRLGAGGPRAVPRWVPKWVPTWIKMSERDP